MRTLKVLQAENSHDNEVYYEVAYIGKYSAP